MIQIQDNSNIERLNIGTRRSPETMNDLGNQDDRGTNQESDLGEMYKRKNRQARRYRATAQNLVKSFGGSNQKELMKALKEGKAVTDDTNQMSSADIGYLIAVSIVFDGLSFLICLLDFVIPLLGTLIEKITIFPAATLTLYIMYRNRGVNFTSKVLVRFWGSRIIGFIPYISLLPEYTLGTVLIVLSVKGEELTGLKAISDAHPEVVKYLQRYLN